MLTDKPPAWKRTAPAFKIKRTLDVSLKDPIRFQKTIVDLEALLKSLRGLNSYSRRIGALEDKDRDQQAALTRAVRILKRLAREPYLPEDLR